mgnify:FL=1
MERPSFFVMLADRISGEYSQVWDNWSRASERDEAVRRLLSELGTVKVVPMDKKMMAHARPLRLDFQDGTALTIWFDQGLGFLKVDRKCPDRLFPFHGTCEEQIIALKNMGQALEVVPGGTVISLQLSKV